MDALCRVCIEKATKCTSLTAKIENSSNLSFFDFLNKCTSLNAYENDKLPQSLCSSCTHNVKTFYSFVKLAERSDIIFREALKNSIAKERCNDKTEISCEEIVIKNENIEQESGNVNKEDLLYDQTSKNSSLYILDIVKEEPQLSASTPITFIDGEINESEKFPSKLGSIEEPENILSYIDRRLTSIDAIYSDSQDANDSQKTKIEYGVENREQDLSEANGDSLKPDILGHAENTYKCVECDIVFDDREKFRTHCRNHIYGGKHECTVCGKKFTRYRNLQHHLKTHEDKKKCKTGKSFKHFINQWGQMKIISDEKPFECKICGKSFKNRSGPWKHMKIHTGEKPFECETCGKKFRLKETYETHLQVHLNIRYKCRHCGKVYKTKKYLLSHINAQKYKCEICSKIFCLKQYFKYHMDDHNIETTGTSATNNLITTVI